MSSLWNSFEVYNKKKHSSKPGMRGGNHSNVGDPRTTVQYAAERYERRGSSASDSSTTSNEEIPQMVDLSKLSQNEFKRLYESTRKGEPNNRVNF